MTTFFGLRWLVSASIVAGLSLALLSQAKADDNCNNGRGPFGRGNGQTNFYGSPASRHIGNGFRHHNHGHNTNFRGRDWDRDHDRFGRGSYNRFDHRDHNGHHDHFRNSAFRTPAYPGFATPYGADAPYTPYNVGPYGQPSYTTQVVVPTTPVAVPTPSLPSYGRGLNVTTPNGFGLGLNF